MGINKGSKYLRYSDTIKICIDSDLTLVWIELNNYKDVINGGSPDELADTFTGGPVITDFAKSGSFHLGEWLDPVAVIKFQREVIEYVKQNKYKKNNHKNLEYVNNVLKHGFNAIGLNITQFLPIISTDGSFDEEQYIRDLVFKTKQLIRKHIIEYYGKDYVFGDPKNSQGKLNNGLGYIFNDPLAMKKYEALGYTAYFPKPSLIRQEQRTRFLNMKMHPDPKKALAGVKVVGQTVSTDYRDLKYIPSVMWIPPTDKKGNYLLTSHIAKLKKGEETFQSNIDEIDNDLKSDGATSDKQLHEGLERVNCYGLRGDGRDPVNLKGYGGMLPSIVRTDERYMKVEIEGGAVGDRAAMLDATLQTLSKEELKEVKSNVINVMKLMKKKKNKGGYDYASALKNLNALYLKQYIDQEHFKAYISTSKSLAVAKSFSNRFQENKENYSYIYAVRCRGGYHVPSYTKDGVGKAKLQVIHSFAQKHEQEVAVAGAIWWEDIVGYRRVYGCEYGQFLVGPVYLQDRMKTGSRQGVKSIGKPSKGYASKSVFYSPQDRKGFNELFELLSGKSQGKDNADQYDEGDVEQKIFNSYELMKDDDWSFKPFIDDDPSLKMKLKQPNQAIPGTPGKPITSTVPATSAVPASPVTSGATGYLGQLQHMQQIADSKD